MHPINSISRTSCKADQRIRHDRPEGTAASNACELHIHATCTRSPAGGFQIRGGPWVERQSKRPRTFRLCVVLIFCVESSGVGCSGFLPLQGAELQMVSGMTPEHLTIDPYTPPRLNLGIKGGCLPEQDGPAFILV